MKVGGAKTAFTFSPLYIHSCKIRIPHARKEGSTMSHLVLGSQSARRKQLLTMAGYAFEVRSPEIDETSTMNSPEETVLDLSQRKSNAITIESDEVLLTSDTVVVIRDYILGKPDSLKDAYMYLRLLSGHTHYVYTGVTIRSFMHQKSFVVPTAVTFFPLEEWEINAYINTGEVWDKAGGYGIQGKGALLVEKIEGDYYSVVGLPLSRVVRELQEFEIFPSFSSLHEE